MSEKTSAIVRKGIGVVAIFGLAALGSNFARVPLNFRDDLPDRIFKLLAVLGAVCIFLERAIEVFLSAFRAGDADHLDQAIEKAQKRIDGVTAQGGAVSEADKARLEDLMTQRTRYRNSSRSWALWGGLFAGIVVALVGFRVLRFMLQDGNYPEDGWRGAMFVAVDVLLSGAMLAGGSDGINKIAKLYATVMESTGKRLQNAAKPSPTPSDDDASSGQK